MWLLLFLLASGVLREGDATGICGQDEATSYEKAVFDAVASLVAADGDDERAIELHFKVCLCCVVCGSFLDCTCYQFLFFFSKKEKNLSFLQLLSEFPKDLLSLQRGQLLAFYLGRPDLSLRLVEQVLSNCK